MNTEWKRDKQYESKIYTISKIFGGTIYHVEVWVEDLKKSTRFWFGASSGIKRKELSIFEHKERKSSGGIKALLWIRNMIYNFYEWYEPDEGKSSYACIRWSDNRRRKIYERLLREGFQYMIIDKEKILIKRL